MLISMRKITEYWSPTAKPIVMHCGAHLGEERDAYESVGVEMVWWIEANPHLMDRLNWYLNEPRPRKGTEHRTTNALLAATDGEEITLNLADESLCSSVLPLGTQAEFGDGVTYIDKITMPSSTIDALCEEAGVQPTMLNLDLQGFELDALHGASEIISGVECVYTELNEDECYVGAPHWTSVALFLEREGFQLARIEMTRSGDGWGDGLWIRKDAR